MAAASLAARVPAAVSLHMPALPLPVGTLEVRSYVIAATAASLQASGLNGRCQPRRSCAGGCLAAYAGFAAACGDTGGQEQCHSRHSGIIASLRPQWPLPASPLV